MLTISLLDLPVEILHCICGHLDLLTILRSFRCVCRKLYAVIDTYNDYKLDITSMSMADFKLISHCVQPESIVSLIVCSQYRDTNQLDLLRSIFDIRQFTRLHSLTLLHTDSNDGQNFFEHICFFQVR